jgi:hypothetical protein
MNNEDVVAQVDRAPAVEQEVGGSSPPASVNLETFVPRCEVCTEWIPLRRRQGRDANRTKHTCKAACEKVLREAQKLANMARFCPNCRHPSTPEERVEFLRWRKATGKLREKPGNPNVSPQTRGERVKLAAGLRRAMELLGEEAIFKPEVASFIEDMKNLVDGTAANKRTLRSGGDTTGEREGDDNAIE